MDMTSDKRFRLDRHQLYIYLKIKDINTGKTLGRLANLTVSGCMMMSSKKVPLNQVYRIIIESPKTWKNEAPLELSATTRWKQASLNGNYFDYGLEFSRSAEIDFVKITQWIEELGFDETV